MGMGCTCMVVVWVGMHRVCRWGSTCMDVHVYCGYVCLHGGVGVCGWIVLYVCAANVCSVWFYDIYALKCFNIRQLFMT